MDAVLLARWQFAITTIYHFLFVPITLGSSLFLAVLETRYVVTGDVMYKTMTKFWSKIFLIFFAMGVVTGTVGGIVRDLVGNEPSVILRREIYVTASGLGSCSYVILAELAQPALVAGAVGVLVTFVVRGLAITYNWSMPAYRRRPGRTLEEIEGLRK